MTIGHPAVRMFTRMSDRTPPSSERRHDPLRQARRQTYYSRSRVPKPPPNEPNTTSTTQSKEAMKKIILMGAQQIRTACSQPHESLNMLPRIALRLPGASYFSMTQEEVCQSSDSIRDFVEKYNVAGNSVPSRSDAGAIQCTDFISLKDTWRVSISSSYQTMEQAVPIRRLRLIGNNHQIQRGCLTTFQLHPKVGHFGVFL